MSVPPDGRRTVAPGDDVEHSARIEGAHESYPRGEVASIGELLSDITADLSTLVRQELALAKAEARQSASRAGAGAGMIAGAGVAGWFVLLFLSVALWWALGGLVGGLGWSAVVVAGLWAVTAAVLAVTGRSKLKNVTGLSRTVETAKRVPDALKGSEDHP